jgi:hypothetical protein
MSKPGLMTCCESRNDSRTNLLKRFRSWALPKRRVTVIPKRVKGKLFSRISMQIQRPLKRLEGESKRWNCLRFRRRMVLGKRALSHTCELFAACTSTSIDNFAPVGCLHTLAEAVFYFTTAFTGLVGPFHWKIPSLKTNNIQDFG